MTDVLTAIDDALDTGVATDDDPLTRELQELALALRADAPEPTHEFSEWLDRRVEDGFPKRGPARPPLWRKLLHPAPAIAVVFLIALPLALTWSPSRSGDDDDGGGGGAAMSDGGSGGGSVAREAAPVPDQAAGGAEPAMVLPPADRGFAPGRSNRKIERTIGLELEMPVDDMPRVAEQVTAVTNRHGGFVLSSSVSTGEDGAGGDFELRIPSARLRPALRDLSALADVRSQTQSGRDVTREHVTARDRLQAARAERRSLLRRLENAATDEEAEAIRVRLDLVAGEINGLRGQLRDLRLRTDYAVVTLSLLGAGGDEDGGGGAGGSFDDALGDAVNLLVGVAGVLVRVLAVALPLGLIALAGWVAGRTVRRRRRESALA
ncbi:MAG TPA: DUF4349 domain-containing protein [Thermoleophilaceae bacterium]|nr:DUF4349 domain-containing protein [Thermoleophilaceae bacterium]